MKYIVKILTIVILAASLFCVSTRTSSAQPLLFTDDFEDQNSNGWDIVSGSDLWTIGEIQESYRFGARSSLVNIEAQAGDFGWTDFEFSLDVLPKEGWDRNLFFRITGERSYLANLNLPSGYALHMSPAWIDLQKWTPGVVSSPDLYRANVNWPVGVVKNIRIRVQGNNIKVFEGSNETPIINYLDNSSTAILGGRIALVITTGASNPSEMWFDNIKVKSLVPQPPSLEVPNIKQYSLPWKDKLYDHADIWSATPTIERWGCALTSASMVLKYYGHESAYPDVLNTWLSHEPDGYLRNGLLNWLALSRYTVINESTASPILIYKRLEANNSNLTTELSQERPPILKVPGHFVVAVSQTIDSFGINDPAFVERRNLAAYDNSFLGIESYRPTHTDLSYILLALDSAMDMKVFNPNGNIISDGYYTDSPIMDAVDGIGLSGIPLKIFLLPTPPDGNYQIEISGPKGIYLLNSYLYTERAEVKMASFSEIMTESKKDIFVISKNDIGQAMVQQVTLDSIIEDLDGAWNLKLIRHRFFYKALRFELTVVNRLIRTRRLKAAKNILKNIIDHLSMGTPIFVLPKASSILQDNIQKVMSFL